MPRRTYCRYCYARIENYRGASIRCPECSRVHVRANEEKYWTLETPLRDLERLAKGAAIVLVLGLSAWMMVKGSEKPSLGMGQGYAIGAPIAVLMVLWMTASKITHKYTNFRAGLFWSILLPLAGLPVVALGVGGWTIPDNQLVGRFLGTVLLIFGIPALSLGPFSYRLTRWHCEWKSRYLEEHIHDPEWVEEPSPVRQPSEDSA